MLEAVLGPTATLVLYVPLYWGLLALAIKRGHDIDKSGAHLFWVLLPVIGLLWVGIGLVFRASTAGENRFGPEPNLFGLDYQQVPPSAQPLVVNDVTGLNPITNAAIAAPTTLAEVAEAVKRSSGPLSIGGGRFSMGGQTASPGSLHLDLRRLNRVLSLNPVDRTITVEAGIRWCDIHKVVDPHDLSVSIQQTYANFTVGGSLSVNCHGRYVGLGPVSLSVRGLTLVLADGTVRTASRTDHPELFFGVLGGYGGLAIIAAATLKLSDNVRVERTTQVLPRTAYLEHFRQNVRSSPDAIFHNADLYPPHFNRLRSVTWSRTDKFVTQPDRLMRLRRSHHLFRYLFWMTSESFLGKWRREHVIEPLFYARSAVHWRNYEAGYDVAELEPRSRARTTWVLQEYFAPIDRFEAFTEAMAAIYQRYDVNVTNVSLRHAIADPDPLLSWAREEVLAFVVYYKQGTSQVDRNRVAIWTRELIAAVLEVGGTYYLPYQAHATADQFHRAYPRAREFFALKAQVDPDFRFRNVLWDRYCAPEVGPPPSPPDTAAGAFARVMADEVWSDKLYAFLQNVYRLVPEDEFHKLIVEATAAHTDDEAVYRQIQARLPSIRPPVADLRFGLPSLTKQKQVMGVQIQELLADRAAVDGYVEIGTPGRYVEGIAKGTSLTGPVVLVSEQAPTNSPVDVLERGGLAHVGRWVPLNNYEPLDASIPTASVDLVSCLIGLHHAPLDQLDPFIASIRRVLRPGGIFILRDHDVSTPAMDTFVSLIHTVFNAGLDVPWTTDAVEFKRFRPIDEWVGRLAGHGFEDLGGRLLQEHDPSDNVLVGFAAGPVP